jgi:ribonuclease HI
VALIIHVDGGSRGNPGPAGAGVVIETDTGTLLFEGAYFLGRQTNNAAEYHAVIRALTRARSCDSQPIRICSDSQLLVRQVTGEYDVKSPKLTQLYRQVQTLLLKIPRWTFQHVRREDNQRADELANLAMNRRKDIIVFDDQTGQRAPHGGAFETPADGAGDSAAAVDASASHAVRVTMSQAPHTDVCPAGASVPRDFTIDSVLPAGLCVHAAHALLPTILAIMNTTPEEFLAVPTLIVRCDRHGCGATFTLSPVHSPNGKKTTPAP